MLDFDKERKLRTRLIVRKGQEHFSLKLSGIVLCYTDHKTVFVVDETERKFICDCTLSQLQQTLDPQQFFRANRQCIINIDFIQSFKPYQQVKLEIKMKADEKIPPIIMSQETAVHFRKWITAL